MSSFYLHVYAFIGLKILRVALFWGYLQTLSFLCSNLDRILCTKILICLHYKIFNIEHVHSIIRIIRKYGACTCTHSFLWTFPGAVWLLFLWACSRLRLSSVSWWALLQTSADESQHRKEHEQCAADYCLRGEVTHSHRWFTAHRVRTKTGCQLQLSLSFIH